MGSETQVIDGLELTTFEASLQPKFECFDDFTQVPLTVCLQNIQFNYTAASPILQDVNLRVPFGQIYSLLGPSGCGKSSSLKIIMGALQPRKGSVRVFGQTPGTAECSVPGRGCGYMPQELALMPEMTVGDHFKYYGRIFHMTAQQINKQTEYLLEFLEIPDQTQMVNQLSGGEQRRASLALALLHQAKLIILDEPTVGIDPILRSKVWDYLKMLAKTEQRTIIITTHYIEEARQSDVVALMRSGRILAEASPDRLLKTFESDTLEDVFLKLCNDDDNQLIHNPPISKMPVFTFASNTDDVREKSKYFDWVRVLAVIIDCYRYLRLNYITVIVTALLPTSQVLVSRFAGHEVQNVPISVYVNETLNASFSEPFFDYMENRGVDLFYYDDSQMANDAVVSSEMFASMNVPHNFSECLLERAEKGVLIDDWNIDCGQIKFLPDNTHRVILNQMYFIIKDALLNATNTFFPQHGYDTHLLSPPMKIQEILHGTESYNLSSFFFPGTFSGLIFVAPIVVATFTLLEMRKQGHLERSQIAGVKIVEIVCAHYFLESILLIFQNLLMLLTAIYVCGAVNHGSDLLLFAVTYSIGMSAISLSLAIAVFIHEKVTAFVLLWFILVTCWLTGGGMSPLECIRITFLKDIFELLPLGLPTTSIRNIMNRGSTIQDWDVQHSSLITSFYIVVPIVLVLWKGK